MKPINFRQLNKSYLVFFVNFISLGAFSVFCLYLFFLTQGYEYRLLKDNVSEADQLLSKRREVNSQFDLILARFNELSKFSKINSEEIDNQSLMLEQIHDANSKVISIIGQQHSPSESFLLYKKMTDDVAKMAGIQDSLLITRFQLESIKTQLESCVRVNRAATRKLSYGGFR
jgi:DNA repair ATPase RecN